MVEFAIITPLFFVLVLGLVEAGRFVFYAELLTNATREDARYAIVHGSRSTCPSGPPPPGETNLCDPTGSHVKTKVQNAALDLMATGDLFVYEPVWTSKGTHSPPSPGDASGGNNGRGEHVTVFVDYQYTPLIGTVFDVPLLPSMSIKAESTLVINT